MKILLLGVAACRDRTALATHQHTILPSIDKGTTAMKRIKPQPIANRIPPEQGMNMPQQAGHTSHFSSISNHPLYRLPQ